MSVCSADSDAVVWKSCDPLCDALAHQLFDTREAVTVKEFCWKHERPICWCQKLFQSCVQHYESNTPLHVFYVVTFVLHGQHRIEVLDEKQTHKLKSIIQHQSRNGHDGIGIGSTNSPRTISTVLSITIFGLKVKSSPNELSSDVLTLFLANESNQRSKFHAVANKIATPLTNANRFSVVRYQNNMQANASKESSISVNSIKSESLHNRGEQHKTNQAGIAHLPIKNTSNSDGFSVKTADSAASVRSSASGSGSAPAAIVSESSSAATSSSATTTTSAPPKNGLAAMFARKAAQNASKTATSMKTPSSSSSAPAAAAITRVQQPDQSHSQNLQSFFSARATVARPAQAVDSTNDTSTKQRKSVTSTEDNGTASGIVENSIQQKLEDEHNSCNSESDHSKRIEIQNNEGVLRNTEPMDAMSMECVKEEEAANSSKGKKRNAATSQSSRKRKTKKAKSKKSNANSGGMEMSSDEDESHRDDADDDNADGVDAEERERRQVDAAVAELRQREILRREEEAKSAERAREEREFEEHQRNPFINRFGFSKVSSQSSALQPTRKKVSRTFQDARGYFVTEEVWEQTQSAEEIRAQEEQRMKREADEQMAKQKEVERRQQEELQRKEIELRAAMLEKAKQRATKTTAMAIENANGNGTGTGANKENEFQQTTRSQNQILLPKSKLLHGESVATHQDKDKDKDKASASVSANDSEKADAVEIENVKRKRASKKEEKDKEKDKDTANKTGNSLFNYFKKS